MRERVRRKKEKEKISLKKPKKRGGGGLTKNLTQSQRKLPLLYFTL
jgi:uncharacterized protein YjbK